MQPHAATADDAPSRKVVDGRWEVLKQKLGEGNFGKVYLGHDLVTGRPIAVKVTNMKSLGKDLQGCLKKEIQILTHIDHPNVVKLYDHLQSERYQLLMLEYMQGKDLHQYLKRGRPLQLPIAMRLFSQLSAGLEELYRLNVIHRDLKPQNMLLTSSDLSVATLKIADFGFARFLSGSCGPEALARTVVGSPLYMAPEVLEAAVHPKKTGYTATADLYSVGVILYQLISGSTPYTAMSQADLLAKMQRGVRDPIASASQMDARSELRACAGLIDRLLVFDRSERCTKEELFGSVWVRLCRESEVRQARQRAVATAAVAAAATAFATALVTAPSAGSSSSLGTVDGSSDGDVGEDEMTGQAAWARVCERIEAARLVHQVCVTALGRDRSGGSEPRSGSSGGSDRPMPAVSARVVCLYTKSMSLVAAAWRTLHRRRQCIVAAVGEDAWAQTKSQIRSLFDSFSTAASSHHQELHPETVVSSPDELLFAEAKERALRGSVEEMLGNRENAGDLYRAAASLMRVVAQPTTSCSGQAQRDTARRCAGLLARRLKGNSVEARAAW